MKKLLLLAVMGLGLGLAAHAQSSNANSLENRAKAASHDCFTGGLAGGSLETTLVAQGRCIGGGTINVYEVAITYTCPPPLLPVCLVPAPTPVARVTFDCDNRIIDVTCL
jgi:hypothetical protein